MDGTLVQYILHRETETLERDRQTDRQADRGNCKISSICCCVPIMLSNQHFAYTLFAWNWGSDFSIEISTELIIDLKCNELQDGARLPAFWRYVEAWEEASLSTCVRPYTILNPLLSFPFLLQILSIDEARNWFCLQPGRELFTNIPGFKRQKRFVWI